MAHVVGAVGVPHNPHFPRIVAERGAMAAEVGRCYGEAARHLAALAPDVLVFFTSDHYNIFFVESVPIFSIGVAESTSGPSDYRELQAYPVPIDAPLAREIQAQVVRAGFDVGMSQEFEIDHSVTVPLHFLTPRMAVPIVPVFVSGLLPPLPSARRCYALGAAIRRALERIPDRKRVVAVASGSFSLEIGGPRISDTSHTGVPDPEWSERVVDLLRAGKVDELVAEASEERIARAGNAGGELLDWIAMLGMLDPRPPSFLAAQHELGHAFAAWRVE
jgi:aromatic ring-opening dioxygenase catalytic subunit (LigB family)